MFPSIYYVRLGCLGLIVIVSWLASPTLHAQRRAARGEPQVPIPGLPKPPPSPALPPDEALKTIQLAEGFKIELAASEPMVQDPIVISFDEDGRLFVLEMRSFMPSIDRTGELEETSRISLLEDTDGDGRFDKSTVFVDRLVLPRGVTAINGGIFYVSGYKLFFAQDTDGDGKADRNELIDPSYAVGNVEHAPNGFMRAMDNWIYNTKSADRYRLFNGILVKQRTEFRGQWGITQDNYGRLLYNVNDSQLRGDAVPPNYLNRNSHHRTFAGINLTIATNQQVFTLRMNTAVNRGYSTNVLDLVTGRARWFASSCSPVVYRGDNFPAEFQGNVFVCDPAVNLLKRNLMIERGLDLSSKFAYDDREFLASTDERFRPVNAFNGPDGALWVVDMYRGIVQYGAFMSAYLRRDTLERGLDKHINLGRIYRVVSTGKAPGKAPQLSKETSAALVGRLSHPNGWIRDTVQRLLVERGDRSTVPQLIQLAQKGAEPLGRIHALWTLEGLFLAPPKALTDAAKIQAAFDGSPVAGSSGKAVPRLAPVELSAMFEAPAVPPDVLEAIVKAVDDAHPKVQIAAMRVAESLTAWSPPRQKSLLQKLSQLGNTAPAEVLFQGALSAGNLSKPEALHVLAGIASHQASEPLMRDAIVSGLQDWELQFIQRLLADSRWEGEQSGRAELLQALASAVIKERKAEKIEMLLNSAVSQKANQTWRQKSLLNGIAVNALSRSSLIALTSAPSAFDVWAKSEDAQIHEQSDRIKRMFSWPGHQSDLPPTQAETSRALTGAEAALLAQGKVYYQQTCAGCHGMNGEGVVPVAPPLASSSWVVGPSSRLLRIVLQGVEGPIQVNGSKFEPPQTMPAMPPLESMMDDFTASAILNYIRREWGHEADLLSTNDVARVRTETATRKASWTEAELLELK